MHRAQSNSPRIPPKKYHSFKVTRDINVDDLLLLPGFKPRRPRPPSYPAHVSPSRSQLHVPCIRVTCVPEPAAAGPSVRWRSPGKSPGRSPSRSPESRGRSPARRVSRRMKSLLGLPLLGPGSWSQCALANRLTRVSGALFTNGSALSSFSSTKLFPLFNPPPPITGLLGSLLQPFPDL